MGRTFCSRTTRRPARRGQTGDRRLRRAGLAGVLAAAVLGGALSADAAAAGGPPAPKTYGGATATPYPAAGLANATSMAWGDGAMFVGDSGSSETKPNGGLEVLASGTATKVPNGPLFVAGLAWHGGALYLSDGYLVGKTPTYRIEKWSGFDGSTFARRQVLFTAPRTVTGGLNGITFGPGGRLYVGTGLAGDHAPATQPYGYQILSMTPSGRDVKVFASGMRQPWQMAYASGPSLFASDLGQDGPAAVEKKNPPDFLLKVSAGQDYGFPDCNWTAGSPCSSDAKPYRFFPTHSSIMGLAILGRTLYLTSFAGLGGKGGGALYSIPLAGGKVTPVVTGIPGAVDAVAAHDGELYVGGQGQKGGLIYQVKP
jgi:hypothetical protein